MGSTEKQAIAWTIAGADSGGGAGVQADLLTFHDFSVHGCSVITALTAQNSSAIEHIAVTGTDSLLAQIHALDTDLGASAIKLGMLASQRTVEAIIPYLKAYSGFVVCDPVMQSSSGTRLQDPAGVQLFKQLLPHVDLLTPNIPEAEALTGSKITSTDDVVAAAARLLSLGVTSVLVTGGHFPVIQGQRLDYWTDGSRAYWLAAEAIDSVHSHGSGCTLSAAITAAIAAGYELLDALVLAKAYTTAGIRHARPLGCGPGPVAHRGWPDQLEDFPVLSTSLPVPINFADCAGPLGVYPVVDSCQWLEKLLPLGVKTIQLRIKDKADAFVRQQIQQSVLLARKYGARLFINDYWSLAIEYGAYGVHLGQEDLDSADLQAISEAGLRLGVSTHSYYEIARAHAIGPSYIAIGPIYPTTTKVMKFSERGLDRLQQWVDLLGASYTLTAIGGISLQRVPAVLSTGVGSCAMVTAITEAQDVDQVTRELLILHQ